MALCKETATEVAALDPRQYELKAEDEEAAKREAAAEELFVGAASPAAKERLFLDYVLAVPTTRLRGKACADAERLTLNFFQTGESRHLIQFLRCAFLAHKAMDVQKKFTAPAVDFVRRELYAATGLAPRAVRLTKHLSKGKLGLRLHLPAIRRHNTFATFEDWIQEHKGENLGVVWLPTQRLKLGYRAGSAVRELLAGVARGIPMHERSAQRRPLLEIARFIAFKLSREIGEPAIYAETTPCDIQRVLWSCRASRITQLEALQHATWLP